MYTDDIPMSIHKIPKSSVASITSSSSLYSPVSIIRELLDNSIDSGANSITLEIDYKTCGLQFISIKDNGSGISKDDRSLMCLNHTTSKITQLQDISGVKTLGFRGEALYCINQLGLIEISSRSQNEQIGQIWKVNKDGEIIENSIKSMAMPQGTSIIIKSLFKSTPVRYKILIKQKSINIEKLKSLILSYSIIHQNLRIHLKFINYTTSSRSLYLDELFPSKISQLNLLTQKFKLKSSSFHQFNSNLNEIWKIKGLLPLMNAQSEISSIKSSLRIISINNRLLNNQIGIAKQIIKLIINIYESLGLLTPMILVIELKTNEKIIDVNIEPEKNDVLIQGVEKFLIELEEFLLKECEFAHKVESVEKEIVEEIESEEIEEIEEIHPDKVDKVDKVTLDITQEDPMDEDIDWSRNLHETLSSRSTIHDTYIPEEFDDESFNISKDATISNPFTLTNLQKKITKSHLITPDVSIESIKLNKTNSSTPRQTKLSTSKPSTTTLQSTTKHNKSISNTKRFKLSNFDYNQSLNLKIPINKIIMIDEINDFNSTRKISSSIYEFYENLQNVKMIEKDGFVYIGP